MTLIMFALKNKRFVRFLSRKNLQEKKSKLANETTHKSWEKKKPLL